VILISTFAPRGAGASRNGGVDPGKLGVLVGGELETAIAGDGYS
jgi:hypothetical protein